MRSHFSYFYNIYNGFYANAHNDCAHDKFVSASVFSFLQACMLKSTTL